MCKVNCNKVNLTKQCPLEAASSSETKYQGVLLCFMDVLLSGLHSAPPCTASASGWWKDTPAGNYTHTESIFGSSQT